MRSSIAPTPRGGSAPGPVSWAADRAAGDVLGDVLGADAAATMTFLVEQRRRQDEAAAWELRAVAHWAELHRVDTRTEVGAVDPEV